MTRSQRMKPVVQVTESRENEAAEAYSRARQALEQQKTQLQELVRYRGEYRLRFEEVGRTGMTGAQLQQMHRFLTQLDRAIEQQQRSLVTAERLCEQRQNSWNQARGKKKAVDKVVDRYRQQEELVDARREQKVIDEMAQRKGRFNI